MRSLNKKHLENPLEFKSKLLCWAHQFEEVVWLDSNNYHQKHSKFDGVLAVDAFTAIKTDSTHAFDKLKDYQTTTADWIFGYLSYDLKNDTEALVSENYDGLNFPELYFFQPKKLFLLKGNKVEMHYLNMVDDEMEMDFDEILQFQNKEGREERRESREEKEKNREEKRLVVPRISKPVYLEKVRVMLEHIYRGDIYEANFCQEFYAENLKLNPLETFQHLNEISNTPFAVFLKLNAHYLFSASPERYLKKEGQSILSQPIKGTARRAKNKKEDEALVKRLQWDKKERSENIMIVDLVRNDLSKTAEKGSVEVEELCKIYTFSQVHQMISTVKARLKSGIEAVDVLKTTFPMGSMTGAPKISAMKIIEELEETKRGLYSGAVGYFTPKGDFDFNVIIRSILYNSENKYVSFSVGGAITAQSNPESEYEECLLKAEAMKRVLNTNKH